MREGEARGGRRDREREIRARERREKPLKRREQADVVVNKQARSLLDPKFRLEIY